MEAGVAQAPREETAEIWRCVWNRVKCYGDLREGTGALSGKDIGPRTVDLLELGEAATDDSESAACAGRYSVLFQRKAKPSAIGAGRRRADGSVEPERVVVIMRQVIMAVVREWVGRARRSR